MASIAQPLPHLSKSDINRFWSRVAVTANPDKCWLWTGSTKRGGYGRMSITVGPNKERTVIATRVSYFIHNNSIEEEKLIMHTCDNPTCVNPFHLVQGTNKDNTKDMSTKGRAVFTFKSGEKHPLSKLKIDDILNIRKLLSEGNTQLSIAKKYNVSRAQIWRIGNKKNWDTI